MIHKYRNGIIIPTQLNVDEGLYDKEAQLILTIKVQQTIRLMDEYKKGKIGSLMHKAYFNRVHQLQSEEYHIIEFTDICRNTTCSAGVFPVAGRCKATTQKNKG